MQGQKESGVFMDMSADYTETTCSSIVNASYASTIWAAKYIHLKAPVAGKYKVLYSPNKAFKAMFPFLSGEEHSGSRRL